MDAPPFELEWCTRSVIRPPTQPVSFIVFEDPNRILPDTAVVDALPGSQCAYNLTVHLAACDGAG